MAADSLHDACLATMIARRHMLSSQKETNNPLMLESTGSFYGILTFKSAAECIREWIRQGALTDGRHLSEIWEFESTPPPPPEPIPDRVSQPMKKDLTEWYGTVKAFDLTDPACVIWYHTCKDENRFPALTRITSTERGDIYHYENGMKIIVTDNEASVMYFS